MAKKQMSKKAAPKASAGSMKQQAMHKVDTAMGMMAEAKKMMKKMGM